MPQPYQSARWFFTSRHSKKELSQRTRCRGLLFAPALVLASVVTTYAILPAAAQTITQVTDYRTGVSVPASISRNGLTAVFSSSGNLTGSNADHSFEVFALNVATNTLTQLTDNRTGGGLFVSIDDNATTIAFTSQADLTGGNHDQNVEVFAMNANGSGVRQLTSSALGAASTAVIAGGATKIVFASSADLACATCANADHSQEVFIINPDGTGLRQLSASSRDSRAPRSSDDGTRVTFVSSGDLVGTNADLSDEVFVIGADGTGLRQLSSSTRSSVAPFISGNGLKVVFQSNADLTPAAPGNADLGDEIYIINFDGSGLKQLTNSKILIVDGLAQSPSIDDSGAIVVFHSAHAVLFPTQNLDGNVEIWKISATGTGLTALTSSNLADTLGSFFPTLSGDGTRVAFSSLASLTGGNADGNLEFYTIRADKTALAQHTATLWGFTGAPSITADGARIAFASSANLAGTDAGANAELYRVQADGSGLTKLTSAATGDVGPTSISGDGSRIVFQSKANYLGTNSDAGDEVFIVNASGTGLAQLTSAASQSSQNPRIARGGARIVFQSNANLTGGNADLTTELYAVNPDGSGLVQLTSAAAGASAGPRIDTAGALVAFASTANLLGTNPEGNSEIFAVASNGAGLTQLTSSAAGNSASPDISGDGTRVVFSSSVDLVAGSNADLNAEIFALGANGTGLRQLTFTTAGGNTSPVLSGDGAVVTFSSTSPLFQANPDGMSDLYRIGYDGSGLARLSAVHLGNPGGIGSLPFGPPTGFASSNDGSRVAFSLLGNFSGQNPDLLPEVWLADLAAPWRLSVAGRPATLVSWGARAGAWTYDVIRGGVENLAELPGSIDLGPVVCLENDSPDTDTLGFEDSGTPLPGRSFFYLARSSDGASSSDYGASTSGKARVPASGGCAP